MSPALLAVLADALGDRWTTEVEEVWRLAYTFTPEVMMMGAISDPARR
jgi:hypothetical protein